MQLNTRTINDPVKKWTKELNRHFSKEDNKLLTNSWKDTQHYSLSMKWKSKPQCGTISHQSEWLPSKSLQTVSVGEGVEKREPSFTISGNADWYNHYGEECGDSFKKAVPRTAIQPSNPTAGHTYWGKQNWKRHMYPNVHCNIVYNREDIEAT